CCGVHISGVSRHLAALKAVGVLQAEKAGREVRYSLRAEDLSTRLRDLADAIDSVRAAVLDRRTGAANECCDPVAAPPSGPTEPDSEHNS
ncbi:MAG: DNA-binding transcriptional ArsR family regulator, partial [Chlamydiales bacterium]